MYTYFGEYYQYIVCSSTVAINSVYGDLAIIGVVGTGEGRPNYIVYVRFFLGISVHDLMRILN